MTNGCGFPKTATLLWLALFVGACGTLPRKPDPPALAAVSVEGITGIRYQVFDDPTNYISAVKQSFVGESDECYDQSPSGERIYNYLAVSGGGSDGAFGAGLLYGWTETRQRPHFKFVTGVSTGALIAPLAFLGPDYDQQLKDSYTTVNAANIFTSRDLLSLLWSDAAASTQPLKNLIGRFITEDVLDAIAKEHAKGRRLFIASTNLDAQQPVIWDMGAIAASDAPSRLELFKNVMLASASIPSLFPPVLFDVSSGAKSYQELHADGGVYFQSFSVGGSFDLPSAIREAHPELKTEVRQRLYIIRNGRVTPERQTTPRNLTSITERAVLTLLKASGINDLWRAYLAARDDNIEMRYVAIPPDYVPSTDRQFDQTEMTRLFNLGREMALAGIPWKTSPPYYSAPISPLPVE